ncbi:hypothetical protein CCACVL1_04329 [Corchorus capsularis]|uniref:Uncharacterized protein n=1 Tax=Corchorus capsularis TaxID=210143 RepID=A0A1R3JTD7_COCAP|nr:hypothetical protein CCACVL1_04329 [Corchorus capsularis]
MARVRSIEEQKCKPNATKTKMQTKPKENKNAEDTEAQT